MPGSFGHSMIDGDAMDGDVHFTTAQVTHHSPRDPLCNFNFQKELTTVPHSCPLRLMFRIQLSKIFFGIVQYPSECEWPLSQSLVDVLGIVCLSLG